MGLQEEKLNITTQIDSLSSQIKDSKSAKKPKVEWEPLLTQMLALKVTYEETFGEPFAPVVVKVEKVKGDSNEGSSDKNKAKNAKKALEKLEKEAKKEATRLDREAREKAKADKLSGVGMGEIYGDSPMVQSGVISDKVWTDISSLDSSLHETTVRIRGHIQTSRAVGKGVFVLIRLKMSTVQCLAFESVALPKVMINFIGQTALESVVDITGVLRTAATGPITSATQSTVELHVTTFHVVTKSAVLPFKMEDASRPDCDKETDHGKYTGEEVASSDGLIRVGQETRLNYRWLDLRTMANQGIFRVQSMAGQMFREVLCNLDFVEIHTPKLIGGASEGGSDVFKVDYFGNPACLAMSPQLHKQIMCACSGFDRVFETGPVFRAENSNTRRHLCEFTGFDLEMTIKEHYYEVLDVFSDLFIGMFDGINERCKVELERVREQHPFENLRYSRPTFRITYAEGCKLLRDAGVDQDGYEDLSTENEKKLGDIVADKYGVDFFFMDEYPLAVRPFYTMPNAKDGKLSNSYDFFIRGQEILSGAQRIHDPDMLASAAAAKGIPLESIKGYIDSFKYGAMPHGGGGIGMERVVMLFLGLPNIRKTSAFPRDPKRLTP